MSAHWRIAFSVFLTTALAPLLIRVLGRISPAAEGHVGEFEELSPKHRRLQRLSELAAVIGMLGFGIWGFMRAGNTPWLLGLIFGWLVLAPVIVVALVTVPQGWSQWHDFWRFYELTYGISIRLVGPLYGLLCALAVISTMAVLLRH